MVTPHLSPYVIAGSLVFLSGQLGFKDGVITGDIGEQTSTTLRNIEETLALVGLGRLDVIKAQVWLRSADLFGGFNDQYAAFFGAHKPIRSTVVSDLVLSEALVEIEVIALLKSGSDD